MSWTGLALVAAALSATPAPASQASAEASSSHGLLILDLATNTTLHQSGDLLDTRLRPCSTFKIPQTLVALQLGVVEPGKSTKVRDPKRHPAREWWPKGWLDDLDLAAAFERSAVWYYRDLARAIGPKRWLAELERLDYGNRELGSNPEGFWLEGPLAISVREQVTFLSKVVRDQAGFDSRHRRWLEENLGRDEGGGVVLVAKTGGCTHSGDVVESNDWVGWYVGWVQRPGSDPVVFAAVLRRTSWSELAQARIDLAREGLVRAGVLPPP